MKYRVDNCTIDTALFRISSGGRDVPAEPKVFDLLVYLLRHRDRVISRDELFTEVWGGRNVTDATLSNHIKIVRKILGDDGERQRVILTVRGRGYQFIAPVEEITPESEDLVPAGAPPLAGRPLEDAASRPPRLRYVQAAAALVLLVAAAMMWTNRRPGADSASGDSPYILVVPFDVSGTAPEAWEPFADQVVREVIRNLRKISGLRVVPPPSAFTFEGNKARAHIRSQLPEVRYVLDGIISVGAGDAVRITAELEDLGSGRLLWDNAYQTRIDNTNFFAVQSEIAESVSDSLQVVVLEDEQRALAELPTTNLEAYEAYVAGHQQMDLLTRDSLRHAVDRFDEAVALDPQFVAAFIARANANRLLMTYFEPPINMLPEVVDSISTALRLDPDSAEARSSLGLAYVHAWRWEDAWRMLNDAKQRDPSLALTEIGFALYYSGLGDAEGVKRALADANRLDPLNIEIADWGQWSLAMVGEADAALAWAQAKMRQHPEVGVVYSGASVAASIAGDHERAIALATKGARLDDNSPISLITLAQIYGAAGQTDKILPLLEEAGRSGDYMCPYESAVAWIPLGDDDRVFELLNDAVEYRSNCLIFLRSDPRMEPIRDDPRYETLLTRVGLDDIALSRYRK
jgi:DNA-binding winged helix-turn-helix (wHTH) protein/TolB-like protein/Tfp pilus assembly protein PilF